MASSAQRVLVDHFRDGVVSRLVLIAIEDVAPDRAATISKRLAGRLRGYSDFVTVENGEESGFKRDREFLWSNRYLLSDQIQAVRTGQHATDAGGPGPLGQGKSGVGSPGPSFPLTRR